MKIKLFLAPGLIVASIILLIWFVYPAYNNPVLGSGLSQKREKLGIEKEKMAKIDEKIENAKNLSFDISANPEKEKALLDFIPQEVREEEIIDSLNYLILAEGLAVSGISVSPPKEEAVKEEKVATPESAVKEAFDKNKAAGALETVPLEKPAIRNFETKVTVVGDYQKIKNLAEKINRLPRFSRPLTTEIKPANLEGGPDNPGSQNSDPSILQMDINLEFDFLKKSASPASPDDPIFLSKKFDMGPIDKIKQERNLEKLMLEVGSTGKTSPFIP